MKTSIFAAALIALAAPAQAQAPADQQHHDPGGTTAPQTQFTAPAQPQTPAVQSGMPMSMGQMMGGGMMQGRGMSGGMMGGPGQARMGRLSPEDLSAFADAHIAAIHAGLRLSADQERLWPPVEDAMRNLARMHLSHMQAMRQSRGMMAAGPVGLLRTMADHMSEGADAMRKLADAAAPLYATLDEAQKRRLQVLIRMGGRGMMGRGMMGPGGAMMRGGSADDDDGDEDADGRGNR